MAYVDTNDFNPHFRKGSDLLLQELTGFHCKFQSTLPQGKWHTREKQKMRHPDFNPHFRKGSDVKMYLTTYFICNFNPHFRKGSDGGQDGYAGSFGKFQSTLPQGKWHTVRTLWQKLIYFNPHFRKGSDILIPEWFPHFLQFQSTLPQGKWHLPSVLSDQTVIISIHTSAREVTLSFALGTGAFVISIHTSAREVTWSDDFAIAIIFYFNPHFRKGSDCNIPQKHLSIFMKYL